MRFLTAALCNAVTAALLASCSGTGTSPSSSVMPGGAASISQASHHGVVVNLIPRRFLPTKWDGRLHGRKAPAKAIRGIYMSEFSGSSVLGYAKNNSANGPSICSESPASEVQGIATDTAGNLIQPDGGTRTVIVYTGPSMCGPPAGTISDPYGAPTDAASINAMTGSIAVANEFDNPSAPGSISVCSLRTGCTANLTNPAMSQVAGVAMAPNGDCWADAINASRVATLTYFAGCTGAGVQATGFTNPYYGGLDIDNHGNLVTISLFTPGSSATSQMYIYSGCNPACTLVGGPFALTPGGSQTGGALYGHLARQNERFITADYVFGQADIFAYTGHGTGLSYLYSFNNGLSASLNVEGAAYSPPSPK
jgi:hypothetical protein